MDEPVHRLLAGWESFYIIAGSVAGALIGLQFVVIALVADSSRRTSGTEIAAFGTPTVLHFSAALLLSALLSAPWSSPVRLQYTLGICGLAGILYMGVIVRRAMRPHIYQPEMEDWVWYAFLPLLAYLVLTAAAVLFPEHPDPALSLIAAVTLGLVFIGIRNAWDTITYVATDGKESPAPPARLKRKRR